MIVRTSYERHPSCEHDPTRQCGACFAAELVDELGAEEAERLWTEYFHFHPTVTIESPESFTRFESTRDLPESLLWVYPRRTK